MNGFAAYPLNGLDIINSYTLYDGTCSKNIKNIESFYLSEGYEAMIPTNLNLYTGASSKMYEALWVPDEMTSFSNQLYTRKLTPYWVRYQFLKESCIIYIQTICYSQKLYQTKRNTYFTKS